MTGQTPLTTRAAKFDVGEIVITPTASAALDASGQPLEELLARHQAGDWGLAGDQMRAINERGLSEQFNLQSVYATANGERLVVVTNGRRTLTMIHLDPGVA